MIYLLWMECLNFAFVADTAAVVDGDALVVRVDVEREVTVAVAAVLVLSLIHI